MSGPSKILVYGDPSGYFAVDDATDAIVSTFYEEDGGWWRVTAGQSVLTMWVPPDVEEPWREIVTRLTRFRI